MSNLTVKGNASGTGTVILEAPNTNTNRTITLPDSTGTLATTADIPSVNPFTLGTAVASTSGTAIDFTGIPSWAKRITIMFSGVSINTDTVIMWFRIGTGGVLDTTGYISTAFSSSNASIATLGFLLDNGTTINSAYTRSGSVVLTLLGNNTWCLNGGLAVTSYNDGLSLAGSKTLSGPLDIIRITTTTGVPTFDAGTINIMYEG